MLAKDVMHRGPVVTISPEATVEEAARLMLSLGISGLPVIDATTGVVGIITEGDLLRRAELGTEKRRRPWIAFLASPGRLAEEYASTHGSKVGEVMTTGVLTAEADAPLEDVVKLMEQKRIRRVPIVERGRLAGVISRADLMRALITQRQPAAGGAHPDTEILSAMTKFFEHEVWSPRASVRFSVTDGVVELSGMIFDERQRTALLVAAENIPGVRAVRDHLTWVEAASGMALGIGTAL